MKKEVPLTQEEVGQALVYFAMSKACMKNARHSVKINGVWTTIGDGPAVVVTLEEIALAPGGKS